MLWSFLFTGIGLVYLGNKSKGLMIFGIGVLFNILGMLIFGFFHYLSILTWISGMYITYNDSKKMVHESPRPQYSRRVRHSGLQNDRYYRNNRHYQNDGHYQDNRHYQDDGHYMGNNIHYQGNDGYYGDDNRHYQNDDRYYRDNNRQYPDDGEYYRDDDRYW